jgi:3-polyprenyl-4-hydroxybenzoate decarboxylase
MSYYRDVREYLKTLEENGKLVRVMRAINKDTEMHPVGAAPVSRLAGRRP